MQERPCSHPRPPRRLWPATHRYIDDEMTNRIVGERLLQPDTADGLLLGSRSDDTVETFQGRLQVYAEQTRPLLEVHEEIELLRRVDESGTADEVAARVFASVTAVAEARR